MSIIKHITLQKIVAHDFRYDPRILGVCRERRHISISEEVRYQIYPEKVCVASVFETSIQKVLI